MNERDREFADAARVIDESLIMRAISRITNLVGRTFQARRLPALKGPAHIALLATACLTHALLLQFIPDRLAPVKPLAYGMVLAFAALATAAGFITTRSSATATADSSAGTANTRKS